MIGDLKHHYRFNDSASAIESAGYEIEIARCFINDFIIDWPGIMLTVVPTFMMLKWMYADEFSGKEFACRRIGSKVRCKGCKDAEGLRYSIDACNSCFFLNPYFTFLYLGSH